MKINSLISHLNEIYSIVINWEKPVDIELQKYYRARKYLGSKDRRFISEYLYSIIRNHRLVTHIAEKHFACFKNVDYFAILFFINYILSNENNTDILNYFNEIFTENHKLISSIKEEFSLSENNLSLKYSFPDWMIERFAQFISEEDMEKFLISLNMNAPTVIRIIDKIFEQDVKKDFEELFVSLFKSSVAPEAFIVEKRINFNNIPSFKNGHFEVQDIGSQLVTLFVEPNSGVEQKIKILDACAGAGGKSLYLSQLIGDKGLIYAYDFNQKRLDVFKKRLNFYTKSENKNYSNIQFINNEEDLKSLKNKIDILVLDAPCSGSGTIRRNPDLKWRLNEKQVLAYAKKQLSILEDYACYLKEDGKLVYITCSFFKEENENVINHFLEKHSEFKFDEKNSFCNKYNLQLENNFLRLYPHKNNTDGFTACVLHLN